MKITCGIYLFNTLNEKFLICHATKSKNYWSIPKGIKESQEDVFQAALRELFEETNIDLQNIKVITLHQLPPVKYEKQKKTLMSFIVIAEFPLNEIELKCHSKVDGKFPEIDKYKWVDIKELQSLIHKTQTKNVKMIKSITQKPIPFPSQFSSNGRV